ncbi:guanosine-diphosphatase [Exophiala viscosa]|uniref:guanosine-diphosphatase n=1 Tax=Exophiala viscosa TaxID=2486360 RepID=A0AAN6DZZ8_9EURO|nr:guanosine-diphosphatase [Exophiala viscosa]
MPKYIQSSWKTQSSRVRCFKSCTMLVAIILLYQFVAGMSKSSISARFDSDHTTAKPPTTQCTRPFDTTKPLIQYTIMIDAGSTGSRVHVYKFNNCGPTPELEQEYFKMTEKRPGGSGLSSYTDPNQAARGLDPLLLFAQSSVPEQFQSCTPIVVKATAGLRLLGDGLSIKILEAVRTRLETQFPFPVVSRDNGGVEIMRGEDEGVFAWITTNYLLGHAGGLDDTATAAVFDLGGGSTQVVFEQSSVEGGEGIPAEVTDVESAYQLTFRGQEYQLYQHSHLGYGLMSARKAIHQMVLDHAWKEGAISNMSRLSQPIPNTCMPPGKRTKVTVQMPSGHALEGEHDIIMEGPVDNDSTHCRALTEAILGKDKPCPRSPCSMNGVYQPSLENSFSGEIYIFSYFYDRTHELGMPDSFTLGELTELTSEVCAGEKAWRSAFGHIKGALQSLKEMPEWCLDLQFMSALLHQGYGMPFSRKLTTANKIRGNEIGWCLGASLPLLEKESGWECRIADYD